MALEIRQSQKLAQKLVLTQQLQQAIELLVLNSQELIDAVNKELLENPALEEVPGTRNEEFSEAENALHQQAARTASAGNSRASLKRKRKRQKQQQALQQQGSSSRDGVVLEGGGGL